MSGAPQVDMSFACMGSTMRLLVDRQEDACWARRYLEDFDRRLSRFRADSELCALNRDPRAEVPASPLLRRAVRAAVGAAWATDGLVDPTLVRALERTGYASSWSGRRSASLTLALAGAPPRRPAAPSARARWREIEVDDEEGVVRRPPGVAIDTGGTGKGLAADIVAERLAGRGRFVVDCGGDLRLNGAYEVEVEHPLTGGSAHTLLLASGGIATSGLATRVWERPEGGWSHHLLDPSTEQPAWTGLLAVTACGPTALQAETLSKAALLSGASEARSLLAAHGGILIHESGDVELVGAAPRRTLVRLPRAAA
jgi:thiamine biosynthesis lipoprotein